MKFTVLAGVGILLVAGLVGLLIWLRHQSLSSEHHKTIYFVTGALQAVHLILYVTGALEQLTKLNVTLAFFLCAGISVSCLLMAGWMLLPGSKCVHGSKYLLLLAAILQGISTVVLFLLPEAGFPPLIQF